MKSCTRHLTPFVRRFPLLPPVETIGYLPTKRDRVSHAFSSCNFSLVLSGSGSYMLRGTVFKVKAPAVLLQWPGEPMNYGPAADDTWEELYLIYPGNCRTMLEAANVFSPGMVPVRSFVRTAWFDAALERIKTFVLAGSRETDGDIGDLLAWELVTASFTPSGHRDPADRRLEMIRCRLETNPGRDIQLQQLAGELGMSVSTLRRYWRRFYGDTTFSAYRDEVFLRESCRRLIETGDPVKLIAERLGFESVGYFSRKFHRLSGMTASDYRERHRVPDFH